MIIGDDVDSKSSIQDILAEIDSYADMHVNWDTYGGYPISQIAIERTKSIIQKAFDDTGALPWFVYPANNGTVGFIYRNGDNELEAIQSNAESDVWGYDIYRQLNKTPISEPIQYFACVDETTDIVSPVIDFVQKEKEDSNG